MTMTPTSKDESQSQCTTVASRTNSLSSSISQHVLEKTLEQLGNFPVEVSAMEEAGPLLRIIRRKLKMDATLLVRGCVARRIYNSDLASSERFITPHHTQTHSNRVPLSSRFSEDHHNSNFSRHYRHPALKRIHYFSDVQDAFHLLQSHAIKPLQESRICAFLTRRVKLDDGRIGTLICASATAGIFSSLTATEDDIIAELATAIEDIYFHRQEQCFQTIRSHLALVNGLVLSLRNSLSDLNSTGFDVMKYWQELKMLFTHNDPKSTPRRMQSQLIGIASSQIDNALKHMQQTADVFCAVIERTVMVARGFLSKNPGNYMQSCAVTNEKGFVSTLNQYLVRYSATLPRNTLLWTFKTENFFSTCSHVTYYHHLMLFLENVIFHWSAICSTVQLTIVFEDSSDSSDEHSSPMNRPRTHVMDNQDHKINQHYSNDGKSDSSSASAPRPPFLPPPISIPSDTDSTASSITRLQPCSLNQQQNWKLSDRKGFDHRLVGNIVMMLQFSDEFGAEEMSFPMEIINQILSLLNSSLSRLSHESAVQIAPSRSMYQTKAEETYVIRVPCTMYFTDAMYESYDKNRRLKQQIKLKRDHTMRASAKNDSVEKTESDSTIASNIMHNAKGKYATLRTPRFVQSGQNKDNNHNNNHQSIESHNTSGSKDGNINNNMNSSNCNNSNHQQQMTVLSRMKRMLGWDSRVGINNNVNDNNRSIRRNQDPHHFNHTPPSSKHALMKEGIEVDNNSIFNSNFYDNKNTNNKSNAQQQSMNKFVSVQNNGNSFRTSEKSDFLSVFPIASTPTPTATGISRNSLWGHFWQVKPLNVAPSNTITAPLNSPNDIVNASNDTVDEDNVNAANNNHNYDNSNNNANSSGMSTSRKFPQPTTNNSNNSNLLISMFSSSSSPIRKMHRVEPCMTSASSIPQQDPNSISTTRIL